MATYGMETCCGSGQRKKGQSCLIIHAYALFMFISTCNVTDVLRCTTGHKCIIEYWMYISTKYVHSYIAMYYE